MFIISKSSSVNFVKLHRLSDKIADHLPIVKQKRKQKKFYKILKIIILIFSALFIILSLLLLPNIITLSHVYSLCRLGKNNLEQAASNIKEGNFNEAYILAETADNQFILAGIYLNQTKNLRLIGNLPWFKNQLENSSNLVDSMDFLSQAIIQLANYGENFNSLLKDNNLSYSGLISSQKSLILKKIFESSPELNKIKLSVSLSLKNLNQTDTSGLLWPLKSQIELLKNQLLEAGNFLEKASAVSSVVPALSGFPKEANYLIFLQNSDELRPSGGFLGTYGLLKMNQGEITDFLTDDIYHLDMPVKDKIDTIPPSPLLKYLKVNKWFLRDANWSPDWPTSARQMESLYRIETKLADAKNNPPVFDGVIGLTPKFITSLLAITGPINVKGTIYDQYNFQNLLQYKVEKGYIQLGVSSWQRKEVIGDIAKELKTRIFNLPANKWPEIINSLNDNLIKKNILLYFKDPQLEKFSENYNWGGELRSTGSDYLMVVDANLAALKTDAVMSRAVDYSVTESTDGLTAKANISYAHHGNYDWKTSDYHSYTRLYVPLGSELIRAQGAAENQVDIYSEAGKTVFGSYITITTGKIGNLYFEYKLPANLTPTMKNKKYALYIQKQPGNDIKELNVDLSFYNNVKSYSPVSLSCQKINQKRLVWQSDLSTDKNFQIDF